MDLPRDRGPLARWWLAAALLPLLLVGWLVIRPLFAASGDPGGTVMAQLVPTASALPGYGTSKLPWTSVPGMYSGYFIKTEPQRDSCDGRPGTEGWDPVVLQAAFPWRGSPSTLVAQVDARMARLGWGLTGPPTGTEAQWSKRLDNGSRASATLLLSPTGSPWWEFVAQGPPVGTAASGC